MTLSPELLAIIADVKPASDEEIVAICGEYATPVEAMLIARLVAERKVGAWQDISTAPKDGTRFMAWPCDFYDRVTAVETYWYVHPSVRGWITDELDCNDYEFAPTLWMPLPPALSALEEPKK